MKLSLKQIDNFAETYCKENGIGFTRSQDPNTVCFYSLEKNEVVVPDTQFFQENCPQSCINDVIYFCHTVIHELSHSTMPILERTSFYEGMNKNEARAFEECVAEMSAYYFMTKNKLYSNENKIQSISYIANWLETFHLDDKKAEQKLQQIKEKVNEVVELLDFYISFVSEEDD